MIRAFIAAFLLTAGPAVAAAAEELMRLPLDRETIHLNAYSGRIRFQWARHPDAASYLFLLYDHPTKPPFKKIRVRKTGLSLTGSKWPTNLWWTVHPVNRANRVLVQSSKKHRILLVKAKAGQDILEHGLFVRTKAGFGSNRFSLRADELKKSELVQGPVLDASAEYFIKSWANNSLNLHFRDTRLSGGGAELHEQRLTAEFGWLYDSEGQTTQRFYLGHQFTNNLRFEFDDGTQATTQVNFISLRHALRTELGPLWSGELSSIILLPYFTHYVPSLILNPQLNYALAPGLELNAFAIFEKNSSRPVESGSNEVLRFENTFLAAGLGVIWRP